VTGPSLGVSESNDHHPHGELAVRVGASVGSGGGEPASESTSNGGDANRLHCRFGPHCSVGLNTSSPTVSFSDLEGTVSRHPSAFNRYCRKVAAGAAGSEVLLLALADRKWKPGVPLQTPGLDAPRAWEGRLGRWCVEPMPTRLRRV
jgi:hypothetical protein